MQSTFFRGCLDSPKWNEAPEKRVATVDFFYDNLDPVGADNSNKFVIGNGHELHFGPTVHANLLKSFRLKDSLYGS